MGGDASWDVAQVCVPGPRALPRARKVIHDAAPSSAQAAGAKGVGRGLLWGGAAPPPARRPSGGQETGSFALRGAASQPAALGIRKAVAWSFRILKRTHRDSLLCAEDS